tara:strand:- start:233 stop:535 length:303 start_codon:yes stop_codon:yes gene_type:complete
MALLGSSKAKKPAQPANPYENVGVSELTDELTELHALYEEKVRQCNTKPAREAIMRAHKENLMDLGMKCKLQNDYAAQRQVDQIIDSLDTRLYRRKRSQY